MNIEEGKFYKTRDGRTVGPIKRGNPNDPGKYWKCEGSMGAYVCAWFEDGSFWPKGHHNRSDSTRGLDLVAERIDELPTTGTLKEIGAKPGDVVECTGWGADDSSFCVGEFYKVFSFHPKGYCNELCAVRDDGWTRLSESDNPDPMLFRIISRASDEPTSPVRTVTTTLQEIVPGVYGAVKVHDPGSVFVRINIDAAMNAADLTAAINTLTEIRDAMTA